MGRAKGSTRGRVFPVVLAGTIGYLIGGWHPTALQSRDFPQDLSAAQSVDRRFPEQWEKAAPAAADADVAPSAGVLDASPPLAANRTADAQFVLLNPEPMVPPPVRQAASQAAASAPVAQAPVQLASAETATIRGVADAAAPMPLPRSPAVRPAVAPLRATRAPAAPHHAVMNRPGYMLDDAQIASIKERLHLTPEQEQMWPAVEAALRNIAYTHAQEARRRGLAGETTQTADIDPQSIEGLKSAAVPLIMSFNDEQKQEVRDLAHVMGLDQLASQF